MVGKVGVLAWLAVGFGSGCISPEGRKQIDSYNFSIKTAWMMLHEAGSELGPPSERRKQSVLDHGQDRFVADLCHFINTKYEPEALYGLGYFGDRRHVPIVAEALVRENPQTQRIAWLSFQRLVQQEFATIEDARQWWSANSRDFSDQD